MLLQSYPEKQRNEILDLLFNRSYGASLHILKVEIGGDGDGTEGSESSHEHVKGAIDCHRGYEWQLMKEARARNPIFYCTGCLVLPAWLRGTSRTQFLNVLENLGDTTQYVVDWVACAEGTHGRRSTYWVGMRRMKSLRLLAWHTSRHCGMSSIAEATGTCV